MAAERKPGYHILNENDEAFRPPRPQFSMDIPSPRPGEVPPALSPLDAFAMHSRMLAKKFEEPAEDGKRISRLPHLDVARELEKRPGYFRGLNSPHSGTQSPMSDVPELKEDPSPTNTPQKPDLVATPSDKERPMSHYPVFGNLSRREYDKRFSNRLATPSETPNEYFDAEEELPKTPSSHRDYFGFAAPRAHSPEPVESKAVNVQAPSPLNMPSLTNSIDSIQSTQPRTLTDDSTRSKRSLAPPKSPAYPRSPRSTHSIRAVQADSGDEDGSINGSQAVSSSRKYSGSSGMSRPQSPFSPAMPPMDRSPSTMSDYSINGSQRRNFSRPLSPTSNRPDLETRPSFESRSSFETRPSNEIPHRYPSVASASTKASSSVPSQQEAQDDATPVFGSGAIPAEPYTPVGDDEDERPSTSYTYRKYTLPRGRNLERGSREERESWMQKQFTWENQDGAEPEAEPVQRERRNSDDRVFEAPPIPRTESPALSEKLPAERSGRSRTTSRSNRSRSAPRTFEKANALHRSSPSVRTHGTDSTDRTIRAAPLHQRAPSAELTAEEHLDLGVLSHDKGELNKSTYHLRLAAKAGLPTAMLLYALACRHGWGMRPNQEEGVMWLRKAIDTSGIEVADVEATLNAASRTTKADPAAEAAERRKRKAQFALGVYELGISYMNGWGCAKDKALALRCYEVAGSWGDTDALAEAGFCYTQGQGCKKDLRKAAVLYRKAADMGMSMAGNSWIYKPKYMDDTTSSPKKGKEKDGEKNRIDASLSSIKGDFNQEKDKPVGRPRTRSIWSRRKEK